MILKLEMSVCLSIRVTNFLSLYIEDENDSNNNNNNKAAQLPKREKKSTD